MYGEHWDGDSVLFEQAALGGGGFQDVQIGKLAVAYGAPGSWSLVVEDRDFSGGVVARHGNAGESSWADLRGFHLASNGKGSLGPLTYPGGSSQIDGVIPPPLSPDREDGYGDGFGNVFQGVRVYDPTMAQWTAPDAYAGDVHDPMSQKPFMWNGNNPLEFQDPSGFDAEIVGGNDYQRRQVQQAIDADIAKGKAVDPNKSPEAAALAKLLDPNNHAATVIITISDAGSTTGANHEMANLTGDSKAGFGVTINFGATDYMSDQSSSGFSKDSDLQKSLQQGIANDAGVAFAANGAMGKEAQSQVYSALRADSKTTDDKNIDDWANANILRAMGFPDDL